MPQRPVLASLVGREYFSAADLDSSSVSSSFLLSIYVTLYNRLKTRIFLHLIFWDELCRYCIKNIVIHLIVIRILSAIFRHNAPYCTIVCIKKIYKTILYSLSSHILKPSGGDYIVKTQTDIRLLLSRCKRQAYSELGITTKSQSQILKTIHDHVWESIA